MLTVIRKMGNSQGVIIPKPLLMQIGLQDEAEMIIENDSIVIRKPKHKVREGWAEASKTIADTNDDELVWPEFSNKDDKKLKW